jgi:outer membrane receptor protein involved in Fe transport
LQGYYLTSNISPVPQNDGRLPRGDIPGGNQFNVNDIGVYSQGSFRPLEGFGITLGARFDHNNIRKGGGLGSQLSPRFVIDYVTNGWILKTIVSRGIQNVSNYTKYDNVRIRPNPSLTSEKILNYEFSISNKISNTFLADMNFYYSKVEGVVGAVLTDHVLMNENIGEFKIKGIQANLYFKPSNSRWSASLNYSFTRGKQTSGTDTLDKPIKVHLTVADIASHKTNVIINYFFGKHFNVNARLNYVGHKETGDNTTAPRNDQTTFPAYLLGNIALSMQNFIKGATLQVVCNNVFDKKYFSPGIRAAGGVNYPDAVLQMGRNFSLRLNYTL